jgi:hypothetical protein
VQGTIGRLTQILRASSIVTTGSDEYVDLMGSSETRKEVASTCEFEKLCRLCKSSCLLLYRP